MDISKGNFAASCADICALIERSSFAAIDLEMTGISSPNFPETALDTPEKSYLAKRDAAKRYSIIQVGLCLFEEAPSSANSNATIQEQQTLQQPSFLSSSSSSSSSSSPSKSSSSSTNNNIINGGNSLRLIARPFNFFVFPSGAPGGSNDPASVFVPRDVVISPDAASFLRNHNMDWSRWIDQGVSYCNRIEMINARDRVWKKREEEKAAAPRTARETRSLLTDEQKLWLDASLVQAASFVAIETRPGAECMLPPIRNTSACVALRAAINNTPDLSGKINVSFRGKRGFHDCLLARRSVSLEEETQRNLIDAVGFTNIFHTLLNQRKPIIGHNCFADWCFMMESFYEPLPPTLDQFRDQMRCAAPAIYDTKILSNGGCFSGCDEPSLITPGTFEQTHLEGLFKAFGGIAAPSITSSSSSSSNNNNNNAGGNIGEGNISGVTSIDDIFKQSTTSSLEITLPLGFQNYSTLSAKGASAHEAGFDALMTGAVFAHFMSKYHHTPLLDSAENKIALFRSMYAMDLNGGNQYLSQTNNNNNVGASASSSCIGGGFGSGSGLKKSFSDLMENNNSNTVSDYSSSSNNTLGMENENSMIHKDFFLPGRHEILHMKHTLGSNVSAVENALKACVENVSFFFGNIGPGSEGECVACFGRAGVNNKNNNNNDQNAMAEPQAESKKVSLQAEGKSSTLMQRPKAVTIAQLNERIEQLGNNNANTKNQNNSYTDESALNVLKATVRTHILAPHMQWQVVSPPSFSNTNHNDAKSKSSTLINRTYTPPPSLFKLDEFKNRDVKGLFRKVVMRRR